MVIHIYTLIHPMMGCTNRMQIGHKSDTPMSTSTAIDGIDDEVMTLHT